MRRLLATSVLSLTVAACAVDFDKEDSCGGGKCEEGADVCVGNATAGPAELEPNGAPESATPLMTDADGFYQQAAGLGRVADIDWYQLRIERAVPDSSGAVAIPLSLALPPSPARAGEITALELCAIFVSHGTDSSQESDSSPARGTAEQPAGCGAAGMKTEIDGRHACCTTTFDIGAGLHRAQLLLELPGVSFGQPAEYGGTLQVRVRHTDQAAETLDTSSYECTVYTLTGQIARSIAVSETESP